MTPSIPAEQMKAWATEIAVATMPSLGPPYPNMLTLDGKVPYLSAALRISILEAAILEIKAFEEARNVR